MRCNEAGLDIIKRYEGLRLKPYLCPAGVWTIGYGSTHGVTEHTKPITEDDADHLLRMDVANAEESLGRMLSVPLDANQWSALTSFVFNLGGTKFRGSTLRALVNKKDHQKAAEEFGKWVYAGGKRLPGLIERRKEERALYLRPAAGQGSSIG